MNHKEVNLKGKSDFEVMGHAQAAIISSLIVLDKIGLNLEFILMLEARIVTFQATYWNWLVSLHNKDEVSREKLKQQLERIFEETLEMGADIAAFADKQAKSE